jgi:hypothetical protein
MRVKGENPSDGWRKRCEVEVKSPGCERSDLTSHDESRLSYELHKRYLIERYASSFRDWQHPEPGYKQRMVEIFEPTAIAFAEHEGLLLNDEEFLAAQRAGDRLMLNPLG